MGWDDLDGNGISDLVEDKLLRMEMGEERHERVSNKSTNVNATNSSNSGSTGNSVFVWTGGLFKYASRKTKIAVSILIGLFGTIGILGLLISLVVY